ncbi:MAG: hypothetical protein 1 [Zeugodacus cucurbitae dicistrovirus]|nr:MAG: hypothetical protein 1 [Zeugodacus cucurbitae dicistrovirus]
MMKIVDVSIDSDYTYQVDDMYFELSTPVMADMNVTAHFNESVLAEIRDHEAYFTFFSSVEENEVLTTDNLDIRKSVEEVICLPELTLEEKCVEKVVLERIDSEPLKHFYLPRIQAEIQSYKPDKWIFMAPRNNVIMDFFFVPTRSSTVYDRNLNVSTYNVMKHMLGKDYVKHIFDNQLHYCLTDADFNRNMLVGLEYTDMWLVQFYRSFLRPLFASTYLSETTISTYVPVTKRWMKLMQKYNWKRVVEQIAYSEFYHEEIDCIDGDALDSRHLMKCGDVESNPGPATLSTLARINDPKVKRAEVQGWLDIPHYLGKITSFLSEQLPALMDKFFFTVEETRQEFHEDVETINNTTMSLTDKLSNLKYDLVKCFILVLTVFLLCLYEQYTLSLISAILGVIGLFSDLPRELVRWLRDYFAPIQEETAAEVQLGSGEAIAFCAPAIMSILAFYSIRQLPDNSDIEKFSKKVFNIDKGITGSLHMFDHFARLWSHCQDWINEKIGFTEEGKITTFEQDVMKWYKDIEHWSILKNKEDAKKDPNKALTISKLYITGMGLKRQATLLSMDRRIHDIINNGLNAASKLYKFVEESNAIGGGTRFKPLGIALFGESQIGKTTMVEALSQDLLYEMGHRDVETYRNEIYSRQAETEFFDGYVNQSIIIVDDAFAVNDSQSKPNAEIAETIRMINEFPHHLHMAILQDKNTYNTSRVVLWTINNINIQTPSLSYPKAFHNRLMENAYKVEPADHVVKKVKDGNGKEQMLLDQSKINTKDGPIDLSIYKITKYTRIEIDGGVVYKPVGAPMDYETFALHCRDLYHHRVERHANKTQFLNSRFEQLVKNPKKIETQMGIFDNHNFRSLQNEPTPCSTRKYRRFPTSPAAHEEKFMDARPYSLEEAIAMEKEKIREENRKLLRAYRAWGTLMSIGSTILAIYGVYRLCRSLFKDTTLEDIQSAKALDIKQALKLDHGLRNQPERERQYWLGEIRNKMVPNVVTCVLSDLQFSFEELTDSFELFTRINLLCIPENEEDIIYDLYFGNLLDKDEAKVEMISSGSQPLNKAKKIAVERFRKRKAQTTEIVSSGSQPQQKAKKVVVEKPNTDIATEACSDLATLQEGRSLMDRNIYKCTLNGEHVMGNVIVVKGQVILMPYHYVHWLQLKGVTKKDHLGLHCIGLNMASSKYQRCSINMSVIFDDQMRLTKNVLRIQDHGEDIDAVLIYSDPHHNIMHNHANIIDKLITQEEIAYITQGTQAVMFGYNSDMKRFSKCEKFVQELTPFDTPLQLHMDGQDYMQLRCGYSYSVASEKGDCGAALLVLSRRNARKWIGMHVAGSNNNEGYSVKLTQELLSEHLKKLEIQVRARVTSAEVHNLTTDGAICPNGDFIVEGVTNVPLSAAVRTKIEPSLIFGEFTEATTKPAYLQPFRNAEGIIIDPAMLGLEKAGGRQVLCNIDILKEVCDHMKQKMDLHYNMSITRDTYARVMTYEEAVQGANDDFMKAVCRTTSPGYPWNSDPKHATKLPEMDCLAGIQKGVICADTLKDERRPIAKVDAGKTRLFAACPQHFVILFRKYYLGFSAWVMHNRIDNEVAVGTNPFSYDWGKIARKLALKGPKVIAGDFSNFDGSLNSMVLWHVFDVIEYWYERNDPLYCLNHYLIRQVLWTHIVNSVHIYKDTIYQWTHSQPSGNPFTVIINSIYNSMILRCAYLTIVSKGIKEKSIDMSWYSLANFDKHVSVITYGDDNCLNISDDCISFFNQETLTAALLAWGHTYTDEGKTGEVVKYRSLKEIAFLKRKFVYDIGLSKWMAPLDESVIWEMLNWKRVNEISAKEALRVSVATALREMVLHGEEKYNSFVKTLLANKRLRQLRSNIIFPSYPSMLAQIEDIEYFLD